jgi:hypothetical protein
LGDREFSDIQIFQYSGKGIPLFMTGHKNCLQADFLLGPGPRLIKKNIKKNLPGRGLTKVEKHIPAPARVMYQSICSKAISRFSSRCRSFLRRMGYDNSDGYWVGNYSESILQESRLNSQFL